MARAVRWRDFGHDGAAAPDCHDETVGDASLRDLRGQRVHRLAPNRVIDACGNAVVGVDLDYEVINNMLMVSASGTAVTVG